MRLDQKLYDTIESLRGDTDRTAYIRDILVSHFEGQRRTDDILKYLQEENKKLLELLAREQAINMTTQQRLLSEPVTEEPKKKRIWEFWKK